MLNYDKLTYQVQNHVKYNIYIYNNVQFHYAKGHFIIRHIGMIVNDLVSPFNPLNSYIVQIRKIYKKGINFAIY
jgi:hypothetical protein